jgi:hypothetical protein
VDVAVEGLCGGGLPAVTFWDSVVAGVIGAGALLAGDRIPDKPLAATEAKVPTGNPMPDAA